MRTIDLARAIGVSLQTVRDYEARGVLPPVEREPNGYRHFTERHLHALRIVRSLLHTGFAKVQVQELMNAAHGGSQDRAREILDTRRDVLNEKQLRAQQVMRSMHAFKEDRDDSKSSRPLHIGAAARESGVPVSTLRFWEQVGLLQPTRDTSNNYRKYDHFQIQCLKVITLLRQVDFSFDSIRAVIGDMKDSIPEWPTLKQDEITEEGRTFDAATTAYWNYVSDEVARIGNELHLRGFPAEGIS